MSSFRTRRMYHCARLLGLGASTNLLDVGGTPELWELLPQELRPRITLVNMPRAGVNGWARWQSVGGDGCRLPFRDAAFDVVFSNSVIEHVGGPEQQSAFASEVRRVGRSYWVQTPNYWYPIEPHLLTPVIHWLPPGLKSAVVLHKGTLWEWLEHPTSDRKAFYLDHFLREIRLLSARQMQMLFPDGQLLRERSFRLTKSLIAVRIL